MLRGLLGAFTVSCQLLEVGADGSGLKRLKAEANLKAWPRASFLQMSFAASNIFELPLMFVDSSDQGLWILGETLQLKAAHSLKL